MSTRFAAPEYYINRELSWLEFNRRVLEEAQDPSQPLLERLKFLCIFSSNLDEFFEIRVAGIKQQIENDSSDVGPDDLEPAEIFDAIQSRVHELVNLQYQTWNQEILPLLAQNNIRFHEIRNLPEEDRQWAHRYFQDEVFPVLTPLAVDSSHPFPQLLNKSHNVIVKLRKSNDDAEPYYAVVQLPRSIPRLIRIPRSGDQANQWDYVFLKSLIREHVGDLFPGLFVESASAFRVTRNSDLYIDDEEAENLLRTIENELRKRNRGNAVRLELQSDCPAEIQQLLLDTFNLQPADLYIVNGPLTFLHLMPLCTSDNFPKLKDRPFSPAYNPALPPEANMFDVIRKQDVLLHHPYETFDSVIDLLQKAARDPQVLAIKMTLYRTSGDSPIVKSLIRAANAGKQVTALVELKARFDEANNIQWARQLEEAGVHVVYGVVGLKTHCKATLIVRRDTDKIRFYAHFSTGNYHPRTARTYTDLCLFTSNLELTEELAILFNSLTGLSDYPGFKKLMVAPFDLLSRVKQMIQREISNANQGLPSRIIVKLNALVDEDIIQTLYEASCAGVKIDLMVRAICCLRPGIPGVSENIRVVSIVGRFLEHSRIYYFHNNGSPEIYLSSADWMPRNLYRRIEIAFPIEDPKLRARIENEILAIYLQDRVKTRELKSDGTYHRLKPESEVEAKAAQLTFREMARKQMAALSPQDSGTVRQLIPIQTPPVSNEERT